MTAPTAATSSSSEAISNASRNLVRKSLPISAGEPKPGKNPLPSWSSTLKPEPRIANANSTSSAPENSRAIARMPGPWRGLSGLSWPPT